MKHTKVTLTYKKLNEPVTNKIDELLQKLGGFFLCNYTSEDMNKHGMHSKEYLFSKQFLASLFCHNIETTAEENNIYLKTHLTNYKK